MDYYKEIIKNAIKTLGTVEYALRGRQEMMTTREFILNYVKELEKELSVTPPVEVHTNVKKKVKEAINLLDSADEFQKKGRVAVAVNESKKAKAILNEITEIGVSERNASAVLPEYEHKDFDPLAWRSDNMDQRLY